MAKEAKTGKQKRDVKNVIKEAVKEVVGERVCTGGCDHPKCGSGAIYGLGGVGAAIYYISTATSFWGIVIGILKAIIWPVFLTYEMMKYLGM